MSLQAEEEAAALIVNGAVSRPADLSTLAQRIAVLAAVVLASCSPSLARSGDHDRVFIRAGAPIVVTGLMILAALALALVRNLYFKPCAPATPQ